MNSQSIDKPVKPERRWDIDWLRVLAVLLLFPFHTARIFDVWEEFYVKNDQLSSALTYVIGYLGPWHMPLFFLLAGASTWFALRFRSGGRYAVERVKRLLIPFLFGLLVLVPPQTYFGLRNHSDYSESFVSYYPRFFEMIPADMDGYFLGGFTLAHLWFIIYLFLISLVALPLFLLLNRKSGQRLVGWLAAFCSLPGAIFLLAVPIILMGSITDFWPDPFYFLALFVLGYIMMADARFGEAIDRHKAIALFLGPVLFLVVTYFNVASWPKGIPGWLIRIYFGGFATWFFLVALLGYGRRLLNFTNGFLKYVGEASYPWYILHQTVIVAIGFYVVQWGAGVPVKYVTILVASFVATVAVYDLVVKRTNVTRFLFGMRPKKKRPEAPAPRREETTALY